MISLSSKRPQIPKYIYWQQSQLLSSSKAQSNPKNSQVHHRRDQTRQNTLNFMAFTAN